MGLGKALVAAFIDLISFGLVKMKWLGLIFWEDTKVCQYLQLVWNPKDRVQRMKG